MCVVCVQWNFGKLTKTEGQNALNELVNTESIDWDHFLEVRELLEETEDEVS